VGTSHRVVRRVLSLPGNPARSKCGDQCVSVSLRKHKRLTDSSQRICILGCSSPAAILGQRASFGCNFRFLPPFANGREPAPVAPGTGRLYGFPTPSLWSLFFHRAARLRTRSRRKLHWLPRAREAIPWQLFGICSDADASAWPGCNLLFHNL
jgi:hypothetical protein